MVVHSILLNYGREGSSSKSRVYTVTVPENFGPKNTFMMFSTWQQSQSVHKAVLLPPVNNRKIEN